MRTIAQIQARRAARGMSDPLNRLRAHGDKQAPITEIRGALVIGEKLWNGATVTPELAAAYNSQLERIQGFIRDGRAVPEQLLNGAFNLIASAQ